MKIYHLKVDWCDNCEQGWIEVKKSANNLNQLIFKCSECFVEYEKYEDIGSKAMEREIDFHSIEPTDDEINRSGFSGYIIKEWEDKKMFRNDGVLWKVWSEEKKTFVKP